MKRTIAILLCLIAFHLSAAPDKTDDRKIDEKTFAGLELRNIGPASVSGRVIDLAVDPRHPNTWFVAAASGGVWKTTNGGTTFVPVFDDQPSYSIGCVTIDPHDSLTVWVGTGENNSQRSVSMGDGVYKSTDGGKTWQNAGLGKSEHIGRIVVDPRDSKTVYVAAQGPLWSPGGDRGLYKTTDGGKSWKAVLTVSENTGVSDVVLDPAHPDTLYASAYQRRRHVYSMINGGPESAIYKSTDAGATWSKLTAGLPKEEMGRIGLAVAPREPSTVYAVIEAARGGGGFFRSRDGGGNWEKMSSYTAFSAQYYQELFPDPNDVDRVYSVDVYSRVTEDGGKTFRRIDERWKHPDSHVVWIDPADNNHLLMGCDGGLYESFDRTVTWRFSANLPITQFYRISADDARPFYNVYGGTQDNFSLAGPSRTTTGNGIMNSDWSVVLVGDGFRTIPDPSDPNVVYSETQHGALARFDRRTGEALDIQPQASKSMDPLRLNWDSPLIVSPHKTTRVYFAAQYLFRSDDRGNSWRAVSGDLTRHLDRNKLPLMGRVWSIDSVAKNASTSYFGNIVSLDESPLQEGLLYAGTDDGLVQVTEDGGEHWRKVEQFPGVPDMTYVSTLTASAHDANTVYATFDNHKRGDFKPYVFRSNDRGRTWTSVAGNLPARGSAYTLAEDFVDPRLLFAGTEYGLYFTQDGGATWIRLSGGMPTIAVRDLAIQKRTNDLVVGTFGRGIYILDDYRALRAAAAETVHAEATLFRPADAPLYVERYPLGTPGPSFQGDAFFTAPNPPFGAVLTDYLRDELKSRRKQRWEEEAKVQKDVKNEPPRYPTWEELRAEDRENEPAVFFVVSDEEGNVIRRVAGSTKEGFHRAAWDLRYPAPVPVELTPPEADRFSPPPQGPLVAPGKYAVRLVKRVDGVETPLASAQTFNVVPLYLELMSGTDRAAVLEFQSHASRLQRAVMGAARATADALTRVKYVRKAIDETDRRDASLLDRINAIENGLRDVDVELNGDASVDRRNEPVAPAIVNRVNTAVTGLTTTLPPTQTHREQLALAEADFVPALERLRKLVEVDLAGVEKALNDATAPWTPGRVPTWPKK